MLSDIFSCGKWPPKVTPTCACGEPTDPLCSHFLKCKLGGEWITRHDSLVHVIATLSKASGFLVQQELPLSLLSPPSPNPSSGRMDLVVSSGDFQTNILADVTITRAFPSSTSPITPPLDSPLHFSKIKEASKRTKYNAAAQSTGATIYPLAIETYGAAGPAFHSYLNLCANNYLQKLFLSHPTREELHKSVMRS